MTYKFVATITRETDESKAVTSSTGLASGQTRISLADGSGEALATQEVDALEATFTGLPTNTFSATAQLLDTNGAPLLDAITITFVNGELAIGTAPTDPSSPAQPAVTVLPLSGLSGTVSEE